MRDFCYFLDQYPLQKHYDSCREYLHHQIDWVSKSSEIADKGVIWFDISDTIEFFPHLELDDNYSLVCYLSSEYHGLWGRVAAIYHGVSEIPTINPKGDLWSQLAHGTHFELPEEAAPPMEAIYNDGTPEGHFEALLCNLFFSALPYTRYEQENWDIIMTEPPTFIDSAWDSYVDVLDWRPRAIGTEHRTNTLLVFRREIENGIGVSSGQDRIYLSQYNFQSRLGLYHSIKRDTYYTKYQGRIDDDTRYTDKRRCCVSGASSVLIACEKRYAL